MQELIPRKIHYCWFGRAKHPALFEQCFLSWKNFSPGFELVEWNESNCDIHECRYVEDAYKLEKWAFVSDYFRMKILYEQGGIYLDCDMELTADIISLLDNRVFFAFEKNMIGGSIIGTIAGLPLFQEILESYKKSSFVTTPSAPPTIVERLTDVLIRRYGLQDVFSEQNLQDGIRIYPSDILMINLHNGRNIAFHHYAGSWTSGFNRNKFLLELSYYSHITSAPLKFRIYESFKRFLQFRYHFIYRLIKKITAAFR